MLHTGSQYCFEERSNHASLLRNNTFDIVGVKNITCTETLRGSKHLLVINELPSVGVETPTKKRAEHCREEQTASADTVVSTEHRENVNLPFLLWY